jgi:hypothetical protein
MTDTGTASVRVAVTDAPIYQWYAVGQWRDAPDSNLFDDFEPYTGNRYARVPGCGPEEAKVAIAAANDAFPARVSPRCPVKRRWWSLDRIDENVRGGDKDSDSDSDRMSR